MINKIFKCNNWNAVERVTSQILKLKYWIFVGYRIEILDETFSGSQHSNLADISPGNLSSTIKIMVKVFENSETSVLDKDKL